MARIRTPSADTVAGEIAQSVRAEMARVGKTQEELAGELDWTQRKLSRRLTGDSPFRADELMLVAAALEVDVSVLLPPTERVA